MWREGNPPMLERANQKRRPDDYTLTEKATIARLITAAGTRLPCPRCDSEMVTVDWPEGDGREVVLEFQCPGCRRRVLLVNVPAPVAQAN